MRSKKHAITKAIIGVRDKTKDQRLKRERTRADQLVPVALNVKDKAVEGTIGFFNRQGIPWIMFPDDLVARLESTQFSDVLQTKKRHPLRPNKQTARRRT